MASHKIEINVPQQSLILQDPTTGEILFEAAVSTAANGVGEKNGSEQTPRGHHIVCEKIGEAESIDAVFVGRQATGELYSQTLRQQHPQRDWILTRILWLDGCEHNKNKTGNVDTRSRFIYIHGAPDDVQMGVPGSHGCIRMRNEDIITLFNLVEVGTPVNITGDF